MFDQDPVATFPLAEAALMLARAVRPEEPVAPTHLAAPLHPLPSAQGGPADAPTDSPVRDATSVVELREERPVRAKVDGLSAETLSPRSALGAAGADCLDLSGRDLPDIAPLAELLPLEVLLLEGNTAAVLGPLADLR